MEIRLIKLSDLSEIKKWLPERLHGDKLPRHTFCAMSEDQIVAFAGLRMCEGDAAIIDCMASNPGFVGVLRHEALDLLTTKILETAKELGFKSIIASTRETTIVARAMRHGFVVVPQILIAKEL